MQALTILAPTRVNDSSHEATAQLQQVQLAIDATPLSVDHPLCLEFLQDLSKRLLSAANAKKHPELVALGFWLRRNNLNALFSLNDTSSETNTPIRKPLGLVVHFTPSNVDTMFIYSWVCALLCGNNNIIRVATAKTDLQDTLLATIDELLNTSTYYDIAIRNCFVSYAKDSQVSAMLSRVADARVIWGGDESVTAIRSLGCKPRCRDICFADRYSATLIALNADHSSTQLDELARKVWKDTEPYHQQACSSPRVMYFIGSDTLLVDLLARLDHIAQRPDDAITLANNQLVNSQLVKSVDSEAKVLEFDNIKALVVKGISKQMIDWHGGDNVFYIRHIEHVNAIHNDAVTKLQTLSYFGVDKEALLKLSSDSSISGIDRIVPVGQALDFSPDWDGYQLREQLTRRVVLR